MANRRNSIKKIRVDEKRSVVNRMRISALRSARRAFLAACEIKDAPKAKDTARLLISKLDRAIKLGTLKENTANRTKSRVQKRLNLVQA